MNFQFNFQEIVAEMKTKQVHVICSSEGEKKKRRVGEGEKSREQRGRRDGGNHGYKAGMEGR